MKFSATTVNAQSHSSSRGEGPFHLQAQSDHKAGNASFSSVDQVMPHCKHVIELIQNSENMARGVAVAFVIGRVRGQQCDMASQTLKAVRPQVNDMPQVVASPAVATHVGPTLKRLRVERGLSLSALAKASGVSVGMLSQIERDMANPSLRVLTQIRQALDVPTSALFESPRGGPASDPSFVRRGGDHPFLDLSYCTKELLTAGAPQANLQMMILHIPPGGSSGAQPIAYPAEKAGLMLEGELLLRVGDREAALKVGDSFIFDSATPHAFHNPSAKAGAKLLWVIGKFPSDPHL